jgi:hypothetical protein
MVYSIAQQEIVGFKATKLATTQSKESILSSFLHPGIGHTNCEQPRRLGQCMAPTRMESHPGFRSADSARVGPIDESGLHCGVDDGIPSKT